MKLKKTKKYVLFFFTMLMVFSCKKNKEEKLGELVEIKHELGTTMVPKEPKNIFVYDMGTLETLKDLNIKVSGIPKDYVPKHLIELKEDKEIIDVGSIIQPNLETVSQLSPDLVIISKLHANDYDQLSKMAPTISLGIDNDNYRQSIIDNLSSIGKIFNKKNETNNEIKLIEDQLDNAIEIISSNNKKILILLFNAGSFSTFGSNSRYGFVFNELKAKSADANYSSGIHGTIVSSEYISKINPDILFIIDRNVIMNKHLVNRNEIENELVKKTNAYKDNRIYYLNPYVWYISGGGTYSVKEMIKDILKGYL